MFVGVLLPIFLEPSDVIEHFTGFFTTGDEEEGIEEELSFEIRLFYLWVSYYALGSLVGFDGAKEVVLDDGCLGNAGDAIFFMFLDFMDGTVVFYLIFADGHSLEESEFLVTD